MLRTAQALADADVPRKRITKSVRDLRRHLPDAMPLSGLSITAEGKRVVVRERGGRWQAESGQYLLEFEGDPLAGSMNVIERKEEGDASRTALEWFERGAGLERSDVDAALRAYEFAIAVDPAFVDAHVNLGRLLHEAKRYAEAERAYRTAVASCDDDPVLLYNLGVLLEDMNRGPAAVNAYEAALAIDPSFADCHYNLALLYEKLAKPREAIQHMARYRRLVGTGSK